MGTNEILAALFFAVFTSNALLVHSAGIDSVDKYARERRALLITAALTAISSVLTYAAVYAVVRVIGKSSTLIDATLVVLSSLLISFAANAGLRALRGGAEWRHLMFNSAVCGIVLLARSRSREPVPGIIYTLIFTAAVMATAAVVGTMRADIANKRVPRAFRGAPILFLMLGLAAMALYGFAGVADLS